MPELTVFDNDLAQRVFLIATILFIALYTGALLFLRGHAFGGAHSVTAHGRAAAVALFIAAAISVVGGSLGLFNTPSGAAHRSVSMSIDALHRSTDVHALPVQQVEEPF